MALLVPGDPGSLVSAAEAAEFVLRFAGALLYIGPDQLMPLTSIFGAIAGVVLMFWNKIVGITAKGWRAIRGRTGTPGETSETKPVE